MEKIKYDIKQKSQVKCLQEVYLGIKKIKENIA
jgi:hypothetical protein